MAKQTILSLQSKATSYSYTWYVGLYNEFRGAGEHSEDMLLRFLVKQAETMAPTTLWTIFSLVKKYLALECRLDLGRAVRVTDYLKTLSRFHLKKKAPSFSREDVFNYLRRASNEGKNLLTKLVLLAGFYGGLRVCELVKLTWDDVAFASEGVIIVIRKSKTDRAGIGATKLLPALNDQTLSAPYYYNLYKDAVIDRTGRLFRNFANNKFTKNPAGKNTLAAMPHLIAEFLELPNPDLYTGHSFRVTSATVLADEGISSLTLKRHGRWASDSVAEGYLRESKQVRKETAELLVGGSSKGEKMDENAVAKTVQGFFFNNCVFYAPVNYAPEEAKERDDQN
jgi:integrase